MNQSNTSENQQKSERALKEERILAFWKERNIFEKTLLKDATKGDFIFYEGPPTANALPALHHLEARAFKDVIPRYKTMQGYRVPRRAGWDTHGLPVELQIEKKLGLTSKRDIEEYGVAHFNRECKESVFTYIKEWETFTDRIGYWVDKESAYYTFDATYMESLWSIVGKIYDRGLMYKDYKIIPWCPRCGTGLSSHELAQGYQDVKDLSVYAKFKIVIGKGTTSQSSVLLALARPDMESSTLTENIYILAWTTTPWTLPGNVALAVGSDFIYVLVKKENEFLILAKERLPLIEGEYTIVQELKGSDLVGLEYEPAYPYLKEVLEKKGELIEKAWKVYAADFVTTTDGTGVVHTAVMYGADDFELGSALGLPKYHTVDETGHFILGTDFLEGRFVKDESVAIDIIKDLAHRGLLFKKEKYEHSYPHCWRCKTPLIYYARDSWYIRMSSLRTELLAANDSINWEPSHIKEGRFGEWLREVKDWAISRERYWGTPLPLWQTETGEMHVMDSVEKLKAHIKHSNNTYFVMRHGETEHNVKEEWNCNPAIADALTAKGVQQVKNAAQYIPDDIDLIVTSPFARTKETVEIVNNIKKWNVETLEDSRIGEWNVGAQYNNKPLSEYFTVRNASGTNRYDFKAEDGESYKDILIRAGQFVYDIEKTYSGKKILIVTHGAVSRAIGLHAQGISFSTLYKSTRAFQNFDNAEVRQINFVPFPHNEEYELDLHKPYIDKVELVTPDGKPLKRVKEVMDVWFDSGSMPFAQDHFPFSHEKLLYPADFISEAIDQTRGWFYTMLAVGVLMDKSAPYKNVICLGHLLDKEGKKMSKSIGNIVEPYAQIDKFGVDAVRYWMYSVNAPGESKNYDEKSVAEINNKVFNLIGNVLSFYELYRDKEIKTTEINSLHVLDRWILSRLNQLIEQVTNSLDAYDLFTPTRELRTFIDDLSTWYLRRSRDRMKDGGSEAKHTLYNVLKTLSQLMAPFAPFFAEDLWQKLKNDGDEESVHLSSWPKLKDVAWKNKGNTQIYFDVELIEEMNIVREICTLGNSERKKHNIPVRQPLSNLLINDISLHLNKSLYYEIIKEELNIKKVSPFNPMNKETSESSPRITLNIDITPELKLEGEYRELVRMVQDMRKEEGLLPHDSISLTLPETYKEIVAAFGEELKKTVGAKEVEIGGSEIQI